MPIDMAKYLALFTSEAGEHLQALADDLVSLEKTGQPEAVDSMFRHAHSIKGMAASMGFEPIARLAHRAEDLIDQVRKRPSLMSPAITDVLLDATDHLQAMVRNAAAGQAGPDAEPLIGAIAAQLIAMTGVVPAPTRVADASFYRAPAATGAAGASASAGSTGGASSTASATAAAADRLVAVRPALSSPRGGPANDVGPAGTPPASTATAAEAGRGAATGLRSAPASASSPAQPLAAELGSSGGPAVASAARDEPVRWLVKVKIVPTCPVPGVRAFLVHKKLAGLGNIFNLQPPLEDLKAGRLPDGRFSLELEGPASAAAVEKVLAAVSDLERAEVGPVVVERPKADPVAGPAAAPAAPRTEAPRPIGLEPARTIRVKTETLDYFLDAGGELLLATAHLRNLAKSLPDHERRPFEEGVDRLHSLVKDLHNKVMSARMTPLSLITDRLPRAARDLARKRNREVDLVLIGVDIELDRAILDELADPLLHLLRNCIDHGIEDPDVRARSGKGPRGRIVVAARRDRDRVLLEVEDDGRGMDAERLKAVALERGLITEEAAAAMGPREAWMLSCMPGVSTASSVTDLSGRGVGMDAVKRVVENVGGSLEIDSTPGQGSRFRLSLPLTVAVVNVLLVTVGREIYGVPIAKVRAVLEADPATLERSRNAPLIAHQGRLLPVHVLGGLLEIERTPAAGARPHVVVETEGGAEVALEVDRLLGQEEAVLKPLSRPLDLLAGLAGVTILGSGKPIFILDVPRLVAAA